MFVVEAMGTCVGMVSLSQRNPCALGEINVEEDMGACVAMEEVGREDGALLVIKEEEEEAVGTWETMEVTWETMEGIWEIMEGIWDLSVSPKIIWVERRNRRLCPRLEKTARATVGAAVTTDTR